MGWAPREGATVTDITGVNYVLGEKLGSGGQGAVYSTDAEGAAVKISDSPRPPEAIEMQLRKVARMPIGDLDVAQPRHLIRPPAVGYTMTLLTGMSSASQLSEPPGKGGDIAWYQGTGGMRKRLSAIALVSRLISRLHERGLVYGDVNGGNVMVSSAAEQAKVFLIDLDNLATASDEPARIMTAEYAAPEQRAEGVSQSTDAFSLGVLAYKVLCATTPFSGPALDELPPEELHKKEPWSLMVPWIDDPDDRADLGLPRAHTLSPRLRSWFKQMFTAGRFDTAARPPTGLLAHAARSAMLALARCPDCGWDDYGTTPSCFACGRPTVMKGVRLFEELMPGTWRPPRRAGLIAVKATGDTVVDAADLGMPVLSDASGIILRQRPDGLELEAVAHGLELQGSDGIRTRSITVGRDEPVRLIRAARVPMILLPVL